MLDNDLMEKLLYLKKKPDSFKTPYEAGRDAALNGANTKNCDFRWFGSIESTREWERGNNSIKKGK